MAKDETVENWAALYDLDKKCGLLVCQTCCNYLLNICIYILVL